MDNFLKLQAFERTEIFTETATRMNVLPEIIEKDFFVCWTLKHLFDIADSGNVMPPKSTWFEPKLRDGLLTHLINE